MSILRAAFIAALLVPNLARADGPHPSVALEIGACLDVEKSEVRRIVAIELRALMIGPDPAEGVTRVGVDCYNPLVEIRVDDPVTGKTLQRRIDLSSSERSIRARLLALAIAELVSSSWTELVSNPEPAVVPPAASASDDERKAAREVVTQLSELQSPPIRFAAAATGRWFLRDKALLLGGAVRLLPRLGLGSLSLSASVDHGKIAASLGEISITTATGGIGWLLRSTGSRWVLDGGADLRGGAVWLSGTPRSIDRAAGASGVALFAGPAIVGRVAFVPWKMAELVLEGELGYALAGANGRVAGATELHIDGVWAGVALGVGIAK